MYKDKDRQREANRIAKQRARQGMTQEKLVIPANVIPDFEAEKQRAPTEKWAVAGWPPNWMSPLAWRAWMHKHRPNYCKALRSQAVGPYRAYTDLPEGQFNRVAKPGDTDYEGKDLVRQVQTA